MRSNKNKFILPTPGKQTYSVYRRNKFIRIHVVNYKKRGGQLFIYEKILQQSKAHRALGVGQWMAILKSYKYVWADNIRRKLDMKYDVCEVF